MFKTIRPFHYLWKAIVAERSPQQIAWGIALGVLVGIVPKGNLTAWLFGLLLLATRVNLGVGMLTAFLVTGLSSLTDPLTHGIGIDYSKSRFCNGNLFGGTTPRSCHGWA